MPNIKSLSEFNRNQTTVLEELERTGEPIYPTRNGKMAAVISSPESYERETSFKRRVEEVEMRVHESLMRGYAGDRVDDAGAVEARVLERNGWARCPRSGRRPCSRNIRC